jgi:hypothetical protein
MAEKNSLTEAERNRIRLEELFRYEVQQQIEKKRDKEEKKKDEKKSRWQDISTFINSAFFLWFLSSVIIGFISFSYTVWQKQREEERRLYEQKQTIEREVKRLDAEISSRLNYVNSLIMSQDPLLIEPTSVSGFLALEKPLEAKYPVNVFPEYSNRTLQSLLWDLSRAVPEAEKWEIEKALNESRKISSIYMKLHPDREVFVQNWKKYKERMASEGKQALGLIRSYVSDPLDLKALNLDRWGRPLTSLDVKNIPIEKPIDTK